MFCGAPLPGLLVETARPVSPLEELANSWDESRRADKQFVHSRHFTAVPNGNAKAVTKRSRRGYPGRMGGRPRWMLAVLAGTGHDFHRLLS
jgi:hypothetical protein